jgi:organic hydroperoxide reductase OsmC/OhrA
VYQVHLEGEGGHAALSSGARPTLIGGPPPELGGRDDWWSPEHLLLSSVGLCLQATFQAMAARRGLSPVGYRSDVTGALGKTSTGIELVSLLVRVEIKVPPGMQERAAAVIETAKKHCIVANSLKRKVEIVSTVEEVNALSVVHSP